MLIARFVGHVLDRSGCHAPIFAVTGEACLVALLALHPASLRLAPTTAGALPAMENPT